MSNIAKTGNIRFQTLSGNCIKLLPDNTYEDSRKMCEDLGGNLAVPLSVEHNRKIAETGMSHLNANQIKLRESLFLTFDF